MRFRATKASPCPTAGGRYKSRCGRISRNLSCRCRRPVGEILKASRACTDPPASSVQRPGEGPPLPREPAYDERRLEAEAKSASERLRGRRPRANVRRRGGPSPAPWEPGLRHARKRLVTREVTARAKKDSARDGCPGRSSLAEVGQQIFRSTYRPHITWWRPSGSPRPPCPGSASQQTHRASGPGRPPSRRHRRPARHRSRARSSQRCSRARRSSSCGTSSSQSNQ